MTHQGDDDTTAVDKRWRWAAVALIFANVLSGLWDLNAGAAAYNACEISSSCVRHVTDTMNTSRSWAYVSYLSAVVAAVLPPRPNTRGLRIALLAVGILILIGRAVAIAAL